MVGGIYTRQNRGITVTVNTRVYIHDKTGESPLPRTIKMSRGSRLRLFKSIVEMIRRLPFFDHEVTVGGGVYKGAGHGEDVEMVLHFFL